MRICYIATTRQNVHTYKWVKYFVEKGHEVSIISPTSDTVAGIQTYQVPIDKGYYIPRLRYIRKIKQIIKAVKPDILHAHQVLGYGMYGALSGFHPLVVSAWGSDVLIMAKKSIYNKLIVRYVFRRANVVLTSGEVLKNAVIELGCDRNKTVLIPWGVNIKMFNPLVDGNLIKQKLSVDGLPTVISIRNFKPIYDIECLITAIPLVLKKIHTAKFIIKGTGELEPRLKQLAKDLGVFQAIRFCGNTSYDDIPYFLRSADIYISTSLSDGSPLSLQEAMACGLPVIVSDILANREWIKDGWNGYLFPTGDSEYLAQRIVSLLEDKEKQRLFGERNRRIVEERANQEKCMEKVEEFYVSLI